MIDNPFHGGLAEVLLRAAVEAGRHSLALSRRLETLTTRTKDDGSPVTRADEESEQIIVGSLREAYPGVPVIGEEGALASVEERSGYAQYFIIDPLDGTKGFLEGRGEFAVNIALMDEGRAAFGVIYSPYYDEAVLGGAGFGVCRVDHAAHYDGRPLIPETPVPEARDAFEARGDTVRIIASRHNMDDATERWIEHISSRFGGCETVHIGSAIKFSRIALGAADVYPRFSACSQWDIAAGHAIVEGSGGAVFDVERGETPAYSAIDLVSPKFVAWSAGGLRLLALRATLSAYGV